MNNKTKHYLIYIIFSIFLSQLFIVPISIENKPGQDIGYLIAMLSHFSVWCIALVSILFLSLPIAYYIHGYKFDVYGFLFRKNRLILVIILLSLSSLLTVCCSVINVGLGWLLGNIMLFSGYILLYRILYVLFNRGFNGLLYALVPFILIVVSNGIGIIVTTWLYNTFQIPLAASVFSNLYMEDIIRLGLGMGWTLIGVLLVVLWRWLLDRYLLGTK